MHRRERRAPSWHALIEARSARGLAKGLFVLGFGAVFGTGIASCGGDATEVDGGAGGHHGTGGNGGIPTAGTDAGPDGAIDGGGGTDAGAEAGTGDAQTSSLCGNGKVDPGEQCDDGPRTHRYSIYSDACNDACRFTCTFDPDCDDHDFCDGMELCTNHKCGPSLGPIPDDPPQLCGQAKTCQGGKCDFAPQRCNDSIIEDPEECDPPDGKGCGPDCRFTCVSDDPSRNCASPDGCYTSTCNDTTHACSTRKFAANFSPCSPVQAGKQCIDGVCSLCGNGKLDPGEECDDGNRVAGDGCEYNCKFSCKAGDPNRDCHSIDPCYTDGTCNPVTHRCSPLQPATDGKSCGSGKDCEAGTCIPIVCGDGIQAVGVEACDDGNLANNDGCTNKCAPSCANAATDCKNVPSCAAATCVNSLCSIGPNASMAGKPCASGGSSATCRETSTAGACTSGVCGDPNVDAGEQCDLGAGNNLPGSGCEPTCVYSCQTDADCNGDPCNGTAKCTAITGGKKCTPGTPMKEGDVCAASPRRICLTENGKLGCVLSTCGDGFTDSANGGTEECDPPKTVGCDDTCKGKVKCNVSGWWGMKATVNVSWGNDPNGALAPHTGQILQWTLLDLAQVGTTNEFNVTNVRVCGITIPDFQVIAALGGEWYGIQFADSSIWDKSSMPTFTGTGRVSNPYAGARIEFDATAILEGLTMVDPNAPWPTLDQFFPTSGTPAGFFKDQDSDTNIGLTVKAKYGSLPSEDTPLPADGVATYRYPIVNLGDAQNPATYGRATQLYLGIRALSSEQGTLDTCDSAIGQANVSSIDNHTVGCYLAPCTVSGCAPQTTTGQACQMTDWETADAVKPLYSISGATFAAHRLSGTAPNCVTVRQTLP